MENLIRLGDIFNNASDFLWKYALYLPLDNDWTLETLGAVLDPMDVENPDDPEDIPDFAKKNSLKYILMIGDFQQVVENAREQIIDITQSDLLEALKFYFKNDAFIEFS